MIENFYVKDEIIEIISDFESTRECNSPAYIICRDYDRYLVMTLRFLNNGPTFQIVYKDEVLKSSDEVTSSNVSDLYDKFKSSFIKVEV